MGTARPLVGVTKARPHPVEHLDHPRGHLYDEPASLVVERSGERFRVELVVLLDVRSDVPVPVFGAYSDDSVHPVRRFRTRASEAAQRPTLGALSR
jgi:hypothetical protein